MKKLNAKQIGHIAIAVCTAVLILIVCIWAAFGNSGDTLKIVEGELVFNKKVRSEYLIGEEVETDGIELHVGKNIYTGDELTFTVDKKTAGEKMVEVSHTEDGNYYRSYFPVTYFYIRHIEINRQPTDFIYDNAGNITGLYGLQLWAELSGEPYELPRPLENHHFSTVIEITEDFYDLTVTKDKFGGNVAVVSCAGKKVEFYFKEINGTMYALDGGSRRVLSFVNENETAAKLTLFVTKMENDYNNGEDGAEGWYVYESADGTTQIFKFAYYRIGDSSYFKTNGVKESLREHDLIVEIDGITFCGIQSDWHRAVFNS